MLSALAQMFQYPFVQKAVLVGTLISLCAALLGVSLVLKRYSMIGDGLSHVGFGALAFAMALNMAPLNVSLPVVVVAAILLLRISQNSGIKGDAAIALVSSSSVALGVIIVSLSTGLNIDICNYLFGSILAIKNSDVPISVGVSVVVLLLYVVFYNKLFAITFDEGFARASGTKAGRYNMLLAVLTALVIVVGMRLMGSMLISSLIIFPALSSMRLLKTFKAVAISSAIISLVCFFVGIAVSFFFSLPSGASIVMANLLVFCGFSAVRAIGGRLRSV